MENRVYREANTFWVSVYGWMASALAITAVTAWYVAATPTLYGMLMTKPWVIALLFILQLVMVIVFTRALPRLSFMTASISFFVYALTLGITLSVVFKVYATSSIFVTFFVSAGMFACMALYGLFTCADLTKLGSIMMMALFGLIIGLLVNLFVRSTVFDMVLSFIGVIVFSLLTAYDMQKISRIQEVVMDNASRRLVALGGAFTLYLDFINLFLYVLRFTGKRNND